MIRVDVRMPGVDGLEPCQAIRQLRKVPIIAVTAHVIQGESEKILACGVTELVTKPIDTVKKVGVIARHLQKGAVDCGQNPRCR